MKFKADTTAYANPEAAARKLLEIANSVEAVQDGRIHIEKINWPFLHDLRGTPAEYKAGARSRDRARLAVAARERHLREIHAGRGGAIRVKRSQWRLFVSMNARSDAGTSSCST